MCTTGLSVYYPIDFPVWDEHFFVLYWPFTYGWCTYTQNALTCPNLQHFSSLFTREHIVPFVIKSCEITTIREFKIIWMSTSSPHWHHISRRLIQVQRLTCAEGNSWKQKPMRVSRFSTKPLVQILHRDHQRCPRRLVSRKSLSCNDSKLTINIELWSDESRLRFFEEEDGSDRAVSPFLHK